MERVCVPAVCVCVCVRSKQSACEVVPERLQADLADGVPVRGTLLMVGGMSEGKGGLLSVLVSGRNPGSAPCGRRVLPIAGRKATC